MDAALIELATRVGQQLVPPPALPPAHPREGQTRDQWLAEVAQLRCQHDAAALQANRLVPMVTPPHAPDAITSTYGRVPVGDGLSQSATIYRPASDGERLPAVLVLHGGGFWMAGGAVGSEIGDGFCRYLATALGAVVVNFDYRLAPEFQYPVPLDDAEAAARWIASSAEDLSIDPTRLAVLGISSGGNLAAALCRRLRGSDVSLSVAMLVAPALDLNFDSASFLAYPEWQEPGAMLRAYYVPDGTSCADPDVSPALADDPDGLPPAVVVVGSFDPLHDDAVRYVDLLTGAGIEAQLGVYPMTHGLATPETSVAWMRDLTEFGAKFL